MPAIFVGHGSPMNAVDENEFTRGWQDMAQYLPLPKAILSISAHWFIEKNLVTANEEPPTIHDFSGFPKAFYEIKYPAPGSPELASYISSHVKSVSVEPDTAWGLDHGTWVVLRQMCPAADIPVVQLSINFKLSNEAHYRLGQELEPLRDEGILILGSGNIVHNLSMIDMDKRDTGFAWAEDWRKISNDFILKREDDRLIDYETSGEPAKLSVLTPDHYLPLLYVLGASDPDEKIELFNDSCAYGSTSMTSLMVGL